MKEPYRIADEAIQRLTKLILRKREKTVRRLLIAGFDELNAAKEIDTLYEAIEKECRKLFREVYCGRYREVRKKKPREDDLDELVGMYIAGLWNEPNESTHYAFQPELIRKRDRAKEAVDSVPTKTQKQLQLEKHVRYLTQQIAWYVDFASQDAEWQALKDDGVKRVRWNVYGDDKVCQTCESMDGNIYDIDDVPERPHLRCRCYLTSA